ncbi:hypothetical protein LR48_Vigan11g121300 [Vigna angularis]|uniref:Uncharacterized protein n=1 Tax=Phaseolus angularis TaxID=3914 RepID=A0A0L9VTT1_PHAAN|nr:hypothetical protein LR48_Vigan11g121300 [Vigna angularis]
MASHEKSIYVESRTSSIGMNQFYPKLVRYFWKNAQVEANNIKSIVIGKAIVIIFQTISDAVNFAQNESFFWDEIYAFNGKVERVIYEENFERKYICNEIVYKELSRQAKILHHIFWRTVLHNNSNDGIAEMDKFSIDHLMTNFIIKLFLHPLDHPLDHPLVRGPLVGPIPS